MSLRHDMGYEGVGIYWALIERFAELGNCLAAADVEVLAADMGVDAAVVGKILDGYGLFRETEGDYHAVILASEEIDAEARRARSKAAITARWSKIAKTSPKKTTDVEITTDDEKAPRTPENPPKTDIPKKKNKFTFDISTPPEWVEPSKADAFLQWLTYKRERGQGYVSEASAKACYRRIDELAGGRLDAFQKIIESSIANNYVGAYPPSSSPTTGTRGIDPAMVWKDKNGGGARW